MNDTRLAIAVVSAPALCILLCALGAHCDPDKPIDVGVTVATPCPEAAAPYVPPPQPYIPTKNADEMARMVENYYPGKMTKEENDLWWARYHELADAGRLEREALQPPHPHAPP